MKTRNVKTRALLVWLVTLICIGSSFSIALAEEITVTSSVEAQLTDWVRDISISKFHPRNGKLQEVHIEIASGLRGDVRYESLDLTPAILRIGMEADILLHGTDGNLIATTHPTTEITRSVTVFDNFWDFAGTSGGHVKDLIAVDIVEADTITDSVALQQYIGTDELFLGLSGNGRSFIDGTGNLSSIFSLLAHADVSITYVYEPPSIDIEKYTNGEDADVIPGPTIEIDGAVLWEYVVENTGLNPLIDVTVLDDQGVVVTCPKDQLAAGEKMTCTGNGIAAAGQYTNEGSVSGQPTTEDGTPVGERVSDSDLSHYTGISLTGTIGDNVWLDSNRDNVQNIDEPTLDGVTVRLLNEHRDLLEITSTGADGYLFEGLNPGTYIIEIDTSTLPENVIPTFDADGIATPHESTIFLGAGISNLEQDFAYIIASIDIETHTNGDDADTPTGPEITTGAPVLWDYIVTNTGSVLLVDVEVTDNQGVAITCPATELAAGESMTCTASGVAEPDQYANVGSVVGHAGSSAGVVVTDSDPSHYIGVVPAIDIETHTNGDDADTPTGPEIITGDPVLWEYIVTNTGTVTLVDIEVTDNQGVIISCPAVELAPMASMTCRAEGTAGLAQYANVGSVVGHAESASGPLVTDTDPSHYIGVTPAPTCPADLLPQVEFLGGTEIKGEAQQKLTLPDGFDLFLVKRTHDGPFRFDIETGTTNADGQRVYTTSWGKIERVWACAGNCTFTQALEGTVAIGQATEGAIIHALIIDNDIDERYLWWAANDPQNQIAQVQEEGMTNYINYTVPFDADWHIYSEDSVGVVSTCIENQPTGGGSASDNSRNLEIVLPFVIFSATE